MARILFTWELGGGMGHSSCHRPLFKALLAAGHDVWFAMRSLEGAEQMFAGMNIRLLQAPVNIKNTINPVTPICSYAHLLWNVIFYDVEMLVTHLQSWQALIRSVEPDILISDHSPGVLLASRDMQLPKVQIGSGFIVPPVISPLPNMRTWLETDEAKLINDEEPVLTTINKVATRLGITPLARLADLFVADEKILTTFRELEHFAERQEAEYWGLVAANNGDFPEWPDVAGKRIFAYLKPFATLPSLLETLVKNGAPTLVYYTGEITTEISRYACTSLKFVKRPLNIAATGRQSDIAITHAGHTAGVELLLAGCPLLLLPLYLEQYLFAERVVRLGAGLNAPLRKPEGMAAKLQLLMTDNRYQQMAERFAARYADFNGEQAIEKMLGAFERLVNKNQQQAVGVAKPGI
jgi:hypothetical protein